MTDDDREVITRNARRVAREMSLDTAIDTMLDIEALLAVGGDPVMATEAARVRMLLRRLKRGEAPHG